VCFDDNDKPIPLLSKEVIHVPHEQFEYGDIQRVLLWIVGMMYSIYGRNECRASRKNMDKKMKRTDKRGKTNETA
jgi:hypothetical protein